MRKLAIAAIILVLFACLSVSYADDSLDNSTLTTADDAATLENDNTLEITEDNYDQYFNKYTGKFKDNVGSVSTVKIGNVTNKLFTFDRPVSVMPLSDDSQIRNGVIHLIEGSDGSSVCNLVINNTKQFVVQDGINVCQLHGIWFSNSSNNFISSNTIVIAEEEGCYAMPMGYSSNNTIIYNSITSHITSCIVMGMCHNNTISYNYIEMLHIRPYVVSNLIYFNPYGHADYTGPGDCIGNIISNNYLKGFCNSEWSIIVQCCGQSDYTQIINNTVILGSYGIKVLDELLEVPPKHIVVKGNTVINSTYSILTGPDDVEISNNHIIGFAQHSGISSGNFKNSNITIHDNTIEYTDLSEGITVGSDNASVYNNKIRISRYGNGMYIAANNVNVFKNDIRVTADSAMGVYGSNSNIENNVMYSFGKGIVSGVNRIDEKVYNTTITNNRIFTDDYVIYIDGYVFNTTVKDNIVETNQSEAFYINIVDTLEDRQHGSVTDNNVNGVIENTETLIIDDSNFYDYFDEDGYLTYEFEPDSKRIIFFTFLTNKDVHFTDQIILTSNKMANLLYNVSISFTGDACDSSISDFKFYNLDKSSIILDGVENVDVKNNEFTTIGSNIFTLSTIKVQGGCVDCNIVGNDIFISSKSNYAFAISLSEPENVILKKFSKGFDISNNNILIKTTGVGEGIYIDALVESVIKNNHINVISDDSAYGISICNVIGAPHDINVDSNEIILNSKEMSYIIELYVANDCKITNNYLKAKSNGIYAVAAYKSNGITINDNEIAISSKGLTSNKVPDSIGKGEAAINLNRTSQITSISNNTFDVEKASVLTKDGSIIKKYVNNSYVISSYNHDLYFNSQNKLVGGIIRDNETVLFKNFTASKIMEINIPVLIKGYKYLNEFKAYLILSGDANNTNISDIVFNNANLKLDGVCNVTIYNNSFISTLVRDVGGINNTIMSNLFDGGEVTFENTSNDTFMLNNVSRVSDFILIKNSNNLTVSNNMINASGNVIISQNSKNNTVEFNTIQINGTKDIYVYKSVKSDGTMILNNIIDSYVKSAKAVIYGDGESCNNRIEFNRIVSKSDDGRDFAVVFDTKSDLSNVIANNYLTSSNGYLRGNDAVKAVNELVCNNTPFNLYVSQNTNGSEDGSMAHPYSSISKAVENSLSGSIIYVLPGYYNESNLVIDKNITITSLNNEGNVYIDALNDRLFNITGTGILTVNGLKIFNGFSQLGGSLFHNQGKLTINNSMIYNSSSYYDNSNPEFTVDKYYSNTWNSYNCSNLGVGGAILNYGELLISSSDLFSNFAHKGGAIADFGKTIIKDSIISGNVGVHGGAIYTNSNQELEITNSEFINNLAITTLDYCSIKKTGQYPPYTYTTNCIDACGHGGAIYSNTSMNINDSLFENNTAKTGGAISIPSNLVQQGYHYLNYKFSDDFGNIDLNIENSQFRYNEAKDTRYGNQTMLKPASSSNVDIYTKEVHGGAIFGSLNNFHIYNSLFEHNTAHGNGGALCVQARNSTTTACKFFNNTAGERGGALDIFGNSQVFNTEILDNNAKTGGAIQYNSYEYYGHVQNNINMFNITVAGNKALDKGGAFNLNNGNFKITNSNIYGNSAPNGATFSGGGVVDARSNWWGSVDGPDDSVWNLNNVRFRTWLNDKVKWDAVTISDNPSGDDNKGNGDNPGRYYNPSSSTGSSVSTGSTLSGGNSHSGGNSGGFSLPGSWPNGNGKDGKLDLNGFLSSDGKSRTDVNGNHVNENSLSKQNSSTVNDLSSVGMSDNAADSSSSSAGSPSDGDSAKAYEITKDVSKEINPEDNLVNIIFVLVVLMLIVIGYYRKYESDE